MAYRLTFSLALGTSQTGLTLTAQLIDPTGANVGSAVSTGFVERGSGNYLWDYAGFPDGFRGGVEFWSGATLKALVAVNPEEGEYVDAKVGSRLASASYSSPPSAASVADAVWDEALADHQTAGTTGKALNDAGNASTLTAADVWGYSPRTLTQSAASVAAIVAGTNITVTRGDTWTIPLTGLGALTGYTSLWFTVKRKLATPDSDALLQIRLNASGTDDGLLYVNGAVADDETLATITMDDEAAGDITITVDETVAALLSPGESQYDVQVRNGGDVTTMTIGAFTVTADVTRTTA